MYWGAHCSPLAMLLSSCVWLYCNRKGPASQGQGRRSDCLGALVSRSSGAREAPLRPGQSAAPRGLGPDPPSPPFRFRFRSGEGGPSAETKLGGVLRGGTDGRAAGGSRGWSVGSGSEVPDGRGRGRKGRGPCDMGCRSPAAGPGPPRPVTVARGHLCSVWLRLASSLPRGIRSGAVGLSSERAASNSGEMLLIGFLSRRIRGLIQSFSVKKSSLITKFCTLLSKTVIPGNDFQNFCRPII